MAWLRAPLLLALGLGGNAEYPWSRGRTLQEVNLVPEAEAADLKKQEDAQREKAMAEAGPVKTFQPGQDRARKSCFCQNRVR